MSNNETLIVKAEKLWEQLNLPVEKNEVARTPVIALEGHNGAGKSTISGMLNKHFQVTPHMGVPDKFLSGGMKYRMIAETNWQASALYFLSGGIDKIRELENEQSNSGFHLIERSLWSTLSAHASEDPERLAKLVAILSKLGMDVCEPDYTIILNATFDHCYGRIQLKEDEEEKKLDALLTHESYYLKEAVFYRWLSKQRQKRIYQINVTDRESVDVFNEDVLPIINNIRSKLL